MPHLPCLKTRWIGTLSVALLTTAFSAPPAHAVDYQAYLDSGMQPLNSGWQEYFGMHRRFNADDPWETVRAPNWYGWRHKPRNERNWDESTGTFHQRVLSDPLYMDAQFPLALTDMENARPASQGGPINMQTALNAIQERRKAAVINIFDKVQQYPLDRDEAHATAKLMYQYAGSSTLPPGVPDWPTYNRDHLYIQLGNEINGIGQWNPWRDVFRDKNLHFNDLNKIEPYVQAFFTEAVKGIRQASRNVYNDNAEAIKIVGPSVADAFSTASLTFYQALMEQPIDTDWYTDPSLGHQTQKAPFGVYNLKVKDFIDIVSIQYPFASSTNPLATGIARLNNYYDAFIATEQAEGVWITEELWTGGPRDLIQRAARYIDWVKSKGLDKNGSRLIWFIPIPGDSNYDDRDAIDGPAFPAAVTLGNYAGPGSDFSMKYVDAGNAHLYLFWNESDSKELRMMAIFEPKPNQNFTLGGIRFHLPSPPSGAPAWSDSAWTWSTQGWQTYAQATPVAFTPGMTSPVVQNGDEVRLDFQRAMEAESPLLISLVASRP